MLRNKVILVLAAAAALGGPALAQSTPPANTGQFMTQEKAGQWRASKLKGLNVYNDNNEKIGDIDDLLVDSSGRIEAAVIGVGGFLGMGEHDVAVPFSQLKFTNEPRSASTTATNRTDNAARPAGTPADRPAAQGTAANPGNRSDNGSRSSPDHAMLNMTKDQLKAAPEFKYAR